MDQMTPYGHTEQRNTHHNTQLEPILSNPSIKRERMSEFLLVGILWTMTDSHSTAFAVPEHTGETLLKRKQFLPMLKQNQSDFIMLQQEVS